jgi:hypothetical protein
VCLHPYSKQSYKCVLLFVGWLVRKLHPTLLNLN